MTVVVLGIDALDPDLIDSSIHSDLVLEDHRPIDTICSSAGEPSTHELWPTIITGLPPEQHGLVLDDGVAWESPVLRLASRAADWVLPNAVQSRFGAWLLNNTDQDAFRVSADYYTENGLSTVFDGRKSKPIGIPNYVVDAGKEDREHQLRRDMGELFERDQSAVGGHTSADPVAFYEQCMEMAMIRIARVRRALRSQDYELVFGYTSGLDLIGHVAYDAPKLQRRAYEEIDQFVGELRNDLDDEDELLLVSDHGLQNGVHTEEAMISGTDREAVRSISSVLDVRGSVNDLLEQDDHEPVKTGILSQPSDTDRSDVREQLESLGYM